ncbi:hypothetical protein GMB86_14460 [Terrilactibacillus sp. BCM23-1]|uniref:Uncharacterized protein n=1 Tax=Terrilactibacillus tamarindi TaxID=2599694 RepID=A0A6N8CU18_9BACI|nr:hypothetical protein [Terrilactibacillus tamarindi]MTT33198.1 hypothetical protein [Terrilactibacillus tamarindi]
MINYYEMTQLAKLKQSQIEKNASRAWWYSSRKGIRKNKKSKKILSSLVHSNHDEGGECK